MMKTKVLLLTALTTVVFIFTSCGNSSTQTATSHEQTVSVAIEVDSLLTHAPSLVNQSVVVEGLCTHTCQHGGTKMFLMGSDEAHTIRIEAGSKLGSFDSQCVNQLVRIKGTLKEERIDEAYLQQWESEIREQKKKQHGEREAGCNTEKLARQETAHTPEGRIAVFRRKIAQRKTSENKPYLSFYFIEASHYEIL